MLSQLIVEGGCDCPTHLNCLLRQGHNIGKLDTLQPDQVSHKAKVDDIENLLEQASS